MEPTTTEADGPVTATEVTGLLTVTVVLPDFGPSVAIIVTVPGATPVTRPAAETVASTVLEDVHVATLVTSLLELSLYLAVAFNCSVKPGFTGIPWETATLVTVGVLDVVEVDAPPPPQAVSPRPSKKNTVQKLNRRLMKILFHPGIRCPGTNCWTE